MIEKCIVCGKEFNTESPFDFLFEKPLSSIDPLCPECLDKKFEEAQPKQKIVTDESSLLKEFSLDCECLEGIAQKENVTINNKIIFGNTYIYELTTAKGDKRWAIETGGQYAPDAYYTDIKLYSSPVTVVDIVK